MPEDAPEQWTELDFLLPATFHDDAPRWHGRFGEDGPDAMVVMDGEEAVYCWKDDNSRGYGCGRVNRRGKALHIEPWPEVLLVLDELPDGAFQITYQRGEVRSVTRLDQLVRH